MIYVSSGLACWNQSESQVSQSRAVQSGIKTALTALANVLETCLKNIKFPEYDHLIINTHKGTKLELNLTFEN